MRERCDEPHGNCNPPCAVNLVRRRRIADKPTPICDRRERGRAIGRRARFT